ncbi:MAG TPA: polymer-forming cytoskeletal protein, partial [Candidatus Nanoarchaeia archaeon]|nr:polymer-forming cytoskeletal protein [Candidatus Nanoarchaeia archaeon]
MMPKKDDLMRLSEAETVIGAGVRIRGTLISDGDVSIEGSLSGEIKTSSNLVLGVNATVKANVAGRNVRITGQLNGNIKATDETSISETGKVVGNINTSTLSIGTGAVFIGSVSMVEPVALEMNET